jgi:hypothetical protein
MIMSCLAMFASERSPRTGDQHIAIRGYGVFVYIRLLPCPGFIAVGPAGAWAFTPATACSGLPQPVAQTVNANAAAATVLRTIAQPTSLRM